MRVIETEDALNVLIEYFKYEIYNIGDAGIILRKDAGRRPIVIALPYGTPMIPDDVLEHVFQHADFTMDQFWQTYDDYLTEAP
jgi:hypothetical protein